MDRLTKHDSDIGYYVGAELVDEYYTSNVDGHGIAQGEAITRLAELENMIEEGELVEVVMNIEQQVWPTISVIPDILFFAFRYALGRRTFAPSIVAMQIKQNIKEMPTDDLKNIDKEIMEAWVVGALGDEYDVKTWVNLQDTIEAELRLRMEEKR